MIISEKLYNQIVEWIDTKVPVHFKQEYRELLVRNEQLVADLYHLHQSYEQLVKEYVQLQKESVRTLPFPEIRVRSDSYKDSMLMGTTTMVVWDIDPYKAHLRVSDEAMYDYISREQIWKAFEAEFHSRYVPKLWEQTKASLIGK